MNRKLDGLLKRMARVDIGDKNSLEAIDDMTEAAAALRAQQARIDALEAGRLSMINSLILIAREARSSGNRTFDQCIDALTHIDDFCRAQLTGDDQ